ncbi:MAG: hypothetical protein NT010_14895 [Proteobacteria bacterium]|nr:hypothetical protein [Pseudomonadota bacterium]
MKKLTLLSIFLLLAFAGCTAVPVVGPGDKPDTIPPKIQIGRDKVKTWDRPGAFGPAPSSLQATGNNICGDKMKAIGYHPNAQDENGNSFLGGGYLCVPK